jgi:hypothetical protein
MRTWRKIEGKFLIGTFIVSLDPSYSKVFLFLRLEPDLPLRPHDLVGRGQVAELPDEHLLLAQSTVRLGVYGCVLVGALALY